MKKMLFVLSSSDLVYGACKSIQQVLKNMQIDFDLMYPNSLFHKVSEDKIRSWVDNAHLNNIYCFFLPFEYYSLGYGEEKGVKKVLWMVRKDLWILDYHKIAQIAESGIYDVVHLNCNTLAPLLRIKAKTVIHIREAFDKERKNSLFFLKMLSHASGIIYIDMMVFGRIGKQCKNELVLPNPIDMSWLQNITEKDALLKLNLREDFTEKVVFSILGSLRSVKGVKKVLHAFLRCPNKDIRLLVVGYANGEYAQECIELCRKDSRIIYLGELPDASIVYKISDYIIRGESFFAIGRTVYEGLYSGCGVIIPGTREEVRSMQEYDKYADSIFNYLPNNEIELTNLLVKLSTRKREKREYESNVDIYMDQFMKFIEKIEGRGADNDN